MKKIVPAVLLLLLLSAGTALAFDYPDITGRWIGSSYGHGNTIMDDRNEFVVYDGRGLNNIVYVVHGQDGRIFWGRKTVHNPKGDVMIEENFSGVFGRNSSEFHIMEHIDGSSSGTAISPDQLEIIHMDHHAEDETSVLLIYELSRSK